MLCVVVVVAAAAAAAVIVVVVLIVVVVIVAIAAVVVVVVVVAAAAAAAVAAAVVVVVVVLLLLFVSGCCWCCCRRCLHCCWFMLLLLLVAGGWCLICVVPFGGLRVSIYTGLCMMTESLKSRLHCYIADIAEKTGIAIPLRPFGDLLRHALRVARTMTATKFRPGFGNGVTPSWVQGLCVVNVWSSWCHSNGVPIIQSDLRPEQQVLTI